MFVGKAGSVAEGDTGGAGCWRTGATIGMPATNESVAGGGKD